MGDIRLRNHIPLGAPATREPCDGSESPLRVSLGFTPRWYRDRLGIDFGEAWHGDPGYRYESLVAMKRLLHGEFPSVDYFAPRFEAGVEPSCATVSGVMGIMVVPALYGLEPAFGADLWPDAKGGARLPREELESLVARPIDLDANPAASAVFAQIREIARRWGAVHGYLNYQGTLNVAVKLRGSDFLMDLYDDPEFAHRLLSHVAGTIRALSSRVQAMQRESGFPIDLLSVSNCTVSMISPAQYEEFVLPLDEELSRGYPRFGVHTCNWNIDPYRDSIRRIPKIGYIDTGTASDLSAVKRAFPAARRAVLYSPGALESREADAIAADFERIAREYAPCDLVLADVETTTPESRVREALAIAESLESLAAEAPTP